MKDKEGNIINLAAIPNPHILVLGRSGQGKTYFCCRRVEQEIEAGKRVLVLDYSGSYTKQELKKSCFKYEKETVLYEPYCNPLYWFVSCENTEKLACDIADILTKILRIESYYQKKWLRKSVKKHMEKYGEFNMPKFVETLEETYNQQKILGENKEDCANLLHLLSRLAPFEKIEKLTIKRRTEQSVNKRLFTIVQLSEYPEQERQFLTKFLLALLWKETLTGEKNRRCDTLVLDECQFLGLKAGDTFSSILREGRKFGLAVLASTQFIGGYESTELETLLQAGNILFFKPSGKEMKFVAELIDWQRKKDWLKQLERLQIGEAIVKGGYYLNSSKHYLCESIVCCI